MGVRRRTPPPGAPSCPAGGSGAPAGLILKAEAVAHPLYAKAAPPRRAGAATG
ncbi:hypothetical protein ACIQMY_04850 [Streptomyces sp. NPDC091368]|uniref:hypothetical protein n=1 Tax=Streptomyces sp. NPDC091368 TaxID=3365993 RepID=UPI00382033A4